MRGTLACLVALLAGTASARADVFVPADPPSVRGGCVAAAGGVVVAASSGPLQVSAGGGAFEPLAGLFGCPSAAATDDGTAAIVASSRESPRMVVRRGDVFGAPIALAQTGAAVPAPAVARGGWAAVAWTARDERTETLRLLVVAPDGRQTRTLLERAAGSSFNVPDVGIGPEGDVIAVWSRLENRATRLRIARVAGASGTPVVSDLGLVNSTYDGKPHALAAAAGGATLLAWAAPDGVRVMSGDGAPLLVSPAPDASRVTAALNEAGAAVVVHGSSAGEIVLVERPAGGSWTIPRVLADVGVDPFDNHRTQSPPIHGTVVTPDGRAVVAWRGERSGRASVHAASGVVGGRWSSGAALSAITRDAFSAGVSLDALGEPRVIWSEQPLRVRGARLATAPVDIAAPVVDARLPSRTRPTRTGRFRVAVRVRCSEACDARLSAGDVSVVRALAAGRTVTLRLQASAELAREVLARPLARRLRLKLLATDRAGNVVRSSRVVRVRVVERPLRASKVGTAD